MKQVKPAVGEEMQTVTNKETSISNDVELLRRRNTELERLEQDHRRIEGSLIDRNRELETLFEVANLLSRPGSFQEKVSRVLNDLAQITQADRALFLVQDEYEEGLRQAGVAGLGNPEVQNNLIPFESVSGKAFRDGQPVVVDDYTTHPDSIPSGISQGVRSAVVLPVKGSEGIVGVLDVVSRETGYFTPERVRFLTAVGSGLGLLLENARLYETLQQHAEELTRSNTELEQFAYVASHDLQEPLRMVTSYVEILGEEYQDKLDENADRYIGYAVDGAKRMKALIDDLLAYSRLSAGINRFDDTDCNEVIHRVVEVLKPTIAETGASVNRGNLPTVKGDGMQLQQLFQNLISNGIKFRADEAPRIDVSAELEGERWLFAIKDNGIGIAPRHHEQVFQMFQRLHHKGKYPGTGVGLAISSKIVQRHGGAIWVDSDEGKGTTVYFTIPA